MTLQDDDKILDEACRAYWEALNEDAPWESLDYGTKTSVRTALVPAVQSVKTSVSYLSFSDATLLEMSKNKNIQQEIKIVGTHMGIALFPEAWVYDLLEYLFAQYVLFVEPT